MSREEEKHTDSVPQKFSTPWLLYCLLKESSRTGTPGTSHQQKPLQWTVEPVLGPGPGAGPGAGRGMHMYVNVRTGEQPPEPPAWILQTINRIRCSLFACISLWHCHSDEQGRNQPAFLVHQTCQGCPIHSTRGLSMYLLRPDFNWGIILSNCIALSSIHEYFSLLFYSHRTCVQQVVLFICFT
jgi:hypothetical protein